MEKEKTKECFDICPWFQKLCPKCNSDNIDWGEKEHSTTIIWQEAICLDCNCKFEEVYEYQYTSYNRKFLRN